MRGGVRVKGKAKGRSNMIKTHGCTFAELFCGFLSFFWKPNDEQNKARSKAGVRTSIFSFASGRFPRLSFLLSFSHQELELFACLHRVESDADASELRGSWGIITEKEAKSMKNEGSSWIRALVRGSCTKRTPLCDRPVFFSPFPILIIFFQLVRFIFCPSGKVLTPPLTPR